MIPRGIFLMLGRILLYLVVLMSVMYLLQDSLMFYPEHLSYEQAKDRAQQRGLILWEEDDAAYRGFVSLAHEQEFRGTVVVFHGNAGEASDRIYYVQALEPLGYRVVLHEYPGYGARQGKKDEQSLVADACQTLGLVREQYSGPVYLFGESIGAGVASGVIAQCSAMVKGIALITPWDNLPDLAQHLYWFLPVKWLLRDQYDNSENLLDYEGRVAVLYAGSDSIIPPEHAQRLFDSLQSEKRLWVFEKADHNSWPAWAGAPWWAEVMQFLDQD
jgi:alpha-beta hydrolase superfamily lysophospholipase